MDRRSIRFQNYRDSCGQASLNHTGEQFLKTKSAVSVSGFTGFVWTEGRLGFKIIRVGVTLILNHSM